MATLALAQNGLTAHLRNIIAAEGPIGLDRYMALCLGHPEFGYYMTRDPFGARGDFTTSPEISQIFGELVGVWAAQVWRLMDSPASFSLVELGPGRGTLMSDCLRAASRMEGFAHAAQVQFVETSPVLRKAQRKAVATARFHDTIATLPEAPSIIIANEFFDAIPIRQFECIYGKVFERMVDWREGTLRIRLMESAAKLPFDGDGVHEDGRERNQIAFSLGQLISTYGGAAITIDYGHRKSAVGDTLQALRNHGFAGILETPGEADITSHVDFEQLMNGFAAGKAAIHPLLSQGEFLQAMGILIRTESLTRTAMPQQANLLRSATNRLIAEAEMGLLFKAACATHPSLPTPFPFSQA